MTLGENYKVNFFDPAIPRKSTLINSSLQFFEGKPLPAVVEISESGTCNRVCDFCPRSAPDYEDIQDFINPLLLTKLVKELASVGFKGIFIFSGFSEPMLDKGIYKKVSIVREHLPDSQIDMVTNGDALNKARIERLFRSGLSTLLISVYDSPEQASELEQLCRSSDLSDEEYVIRHRYLGPDQDFGITINNRSGMMANAVHEIPALTKALDSPCHYPHYTFFMDYQGDVLVCPHDWGKKQVIGNLNTRSFNELWFGSQMDYLRKRLGKGERCMSPCNLCDVKGEIMGSSHKMEWERLNNVIPTTQE